MGFGEAVKTCFSKYATFSGRATRSEFWWFYLFTLIVGIVAAVIDSLFGFNVTQVTGENGSITSFDSGYPWAQVVAYLALLLPMISVSVRRLHDRDASGWWWWLSVLCCIGTLVLIFAFYVQPTKPGPNKYGPDPQGATA